MTAEEGNAATKRIEERKALESFVVENDELLTLESRIGRFNIFDALGITRVEIRHSNFLAFILDPAESHGQGQLFLKAVLMDFLRNAPEHLRPLSPIDLDGTDLRGVEIKREWKNIDLLITCKEPRFGVVIENKVGSKEHSNQLSRYQEIMRNHFPDLRCLYVYLTPDAAEPSEESWLPYRYADIYRVLKRIRDTYQNAIGDDVLVFLDHYLNLLGTRFMKDEKLDELCRQIYKKHRQALDLIWERVGGPQSMAIDEVGAVLDQDARWHVVYPSSKYVEFVPKTWLQWLSPFGPEGDHPLRVHLRSKETNLSYIIFLGPMDDVAKRREIVTKLREGSSNIGFKSSRSSEVGNKWSRICATETILEWGDDDAPEPEAIRASVKKTLDGLFPKLEKLASVLKLLCKLTPSAT